MAKLPDLTDCIITLDALHAVKETFEYIVTEKNADFLVCIKGNASDLRRRLNEAIDQKRDLVECARTIDKEHGRIETRAIEVVPTSPIETGWPHTHVACRVTRDTEIMRRGEVVGERHEQVFYVGSFATTTYTAEKTLGMTRGHWSIENCLHHRKDRSMDEDRCRASASGIGQVMCCIRSLAAHVLGRAQESLSVLYQRFSSKKHLILRLLASGSVEEWERSHKPYVLA
jgi:predicted transposase YbfD/YdcC